MSENRNRDYSKYDSMSTEELEEILRLDVTAPEGEETNTELLLYVMGVLAYRRRNNSTGKTALEAWESFQQNYLSEEEECAEDIPGYHSRQTTLPWLCRMVAAVAVIVLLVSIPVTAKAFEWEDLWKVIARWAKETFSFVSSDDAEYSEPAIADDLEYTSLQDMLERNNRSSDMVPTWIPKGYVLERIEKDITPVQEIYRAFYMDGDKEFAIRVRSYLQGDPDKIEVNEELIETIVISEVQYYIFSNVDQIRVVWIVDSYQCNISGDLSVEEVKLMIDSIGKG